MIADRSLLLRIWLDLGGTAEQLRLVAPPDTAVPLPARSDVAELARASTTAAGLAAAAFAAESGGEGLPGEDRAVAQVLAQVRVEPRRVAVAYSSERHLLIDGAAPRVWSAYSGFVRSADGWIRSHGNYPHHAAAIARAFALDSTEDAERFRAAVRALPGAAAVRAIVDEGGIAGEVLPERPEQDAVLRGAPLLRLQRLGGAAPREPIPAEPRAPLRGLRILDLTRVIAGPVATRTLALLGAEVLRIDPPTLPELEFQHFDTGHGKRSALLDARLPAGREQLDELLSRADAVVLGYRPAALARLGLTPAALARRHPGLVIAQLAAWGFGRADADRAGFDSIVQAVTGIARLESADGAGPGALPAQALDHSAGYLLAAATVRLLARQRREGGSWLATTSLRRIAAELLGLPRSAEPVPVEEFDPAPQLQHFTVQGRPLTTTAPAIVLPGGELAYAAPRPWGGDDAAWR